MFTAVHWGISVTDMERSIAFYEKLGFAVTKDGTTPDGTMRNVRMKGCGFELELLGLKDAEANPNRDKTVMGDMMIAGSKHLALEAADLEAAARHLAESGATAQAPEIMKAPNPGRGFFFVQDPDGIYLEIVGDYNG